MCAGGLLGRPSFDPRFDEVFDRGIDPDVDDPTRCHDHPEVPDAWPSLADVHSYRDRARAAILAAIDEVGDAPASRGMAEQGRVLLMALEHEQMHQETLLYMIHAQLGRASVFGTEGWQVRVLPCAIRLSVRSPETYGPFTQRRRPDRAERRFAAKSSAGPS